MGRRKLSAEDETDHLGMKIPSGVVARLVAIGDDLGQSKSTVGRNFLLLGKAVYDSCLAMGIQVSFEEPGKLAEDNSRNPGEVTVAHLTERKRRKTG